MISYYPPSSGGGANLSASRTDSSATITSDSGDDATILAADGSNAGVMTAAMKTKLDGIESGATADMTPAEILTAVKTVDGDGSGLDADLVRGSTPGAFGLSLVEKSTRELAALELELNQRIADNKSTFSSVAPTVDNDITQGFTENSLWFDVVAPAIYCCQDATEGAAVWTLISGTSAQLERLVASGRVATNFALASATGAQRAYPSGQDLFSITSGKRYRIEGEWFHTHGTAAATTSIELTKHSGADVSNFNLVIASRVQAVNAAQGSANASWFNTLTNNIGLASTSSGGWIQYAISFTCTATGSASVDVNFSSAGITSPLTIAGSWYRVYEYDDDTLGTSA